MTLSVYVAGSSDEIDRAVRWIAMLRGDGIHVTSSWPEAIAKVGVANPRTASRRERYGWSRTCFDEIDKADMLWMLAPALGHGRGSYAELGYAIARGLIPIASGDTAQSVFGAHAHEFADDDSAFAFLQQMARHPR